MSGNCRRGAELFTIDDAVMSVLDAMGLLPADTPFVHESIIGTKFVGTIDARLIALDAALTLRSHGYGCAPVVEQGRLVGILTESDFVDYAIQSLSDPGI